MNDTYSIFMRIPVRRVEMPNDKGLSLSEARFRIKAYIKRNPAPYYFIQNEKTGEEYEIGKEDLV